MKIAIVSLALVAMCVATGEVQQYSATLDSFEVTNATKGLNDLYQTKDSNALTRTPIEVLASTKQVVSGMLYKLTIKFMAGAKSEVCDIEVWSRKWESEKDAVKTKIIACA